MAFIERFTEKNNFYLNTHRSLNTPIKSIKYTEGLGALDRKFQSLIGTLVFLSYLVIANNLLRGES